MRKAIVYCHDTKAGLLEESTPGRGYTFTYDKRKRVRDASIYASKKYRSSFYS